MTRLFRYGSLFGGIAIALVLLIIFILPESGGQNIAPPPTGFALSENTTLLLLVGCLALLGSLFLPEEPKKFMPWVKIILTIIGIGFILVTLTQKTELFNSADRAIEQMNECARTGNCATDVNARATETIQLPATVTIPACQSGWVIVTLPGNHSFTWQWSVRAQYQIDGRWFDHTPETFVADVVEAARFCGTQTQHINEEMPLYWD